LASRNSTSDVLREPLKVAPVKAPVAISIPVAGQIKPPPKTAGIMVAPPRPAAPPTTTPLALFFSVSDWVVEISIELMQALSALSNTALSVALLGAIKVRGVAQELRTKNSGDYYVDFSIHSGALFYCR